MCGDKCWCSGHVVRYPRVRDMYGDIFQDMGPFCTQVKHLECSVGVRGSSQALIPAGLKQHSLLSASVTTVVAGCHSTRLVTLHVPGHLPVPRCGPSAPTPGGAGGRCAVRGRRPAGVYPLSHPAGSGTNSPLNTGLSGTGKERIGGLSPRRWRYARGGAAAG